MSAGEPGPAPRAPVPGDAQRSVDPRAVVTRPLQPERPRSCGGTLAAALGVLVGGIYLLNPTAGVLELIPDVAPGIGNLDEAGAAALLIFGLRYLLARKR
jgi:hypothetical protein